MTLETATVQFCKSYLRPGADRSWYRWKIPRELPDGIVLRNANLFDQTIELRDQLSSMALSQPERRLELTNFYIANWGGIRRNSPENKLRYATASHDDLIARGTQGIASWSKALALRAPDTFAIYDARVALSLNALQCIDKTRHRFLFPITPSRNRTIKSAQARLLQKDWNGHVEDFYGRYLGLLRSVATRLGGTGRQPIRICEVEMCLFALAEDLARRI